MYIIVLILLTFSFTAAYALQGRHFIYMLQIHSFSSLKQLDWMNRKLINIVPKHIICLLTVPLIIFTGDTGMILSGIIYIVLAYAYKPRRYKESMEYNAPVIKNLIALSVIGLLFIIAAIWFNGNKIIISCVFSGLYVLTPLIIIGANALLNRRDALKISNEHQ